MSAHYVIIALTGQQWHVLIFVWTWPDWLQTQHVFLLCKSNCSQETANGRAAAQLCWQSLVINMSPQYIYTHTYIHIDIYIYTHIYVYIFFYIYTFICVCIHVCIYTYMYISHPKWDWLYIISCWLTTGSLFEAVFLLFLLKYTSLKLAEWKTT